jgi:transposase InsO family protein
VANGNTISFKKNICHIHNQQKVLIGVAELENGVYKLNTVKSEKVLAATVVQATDAKTWHRRLGHINSNDLERMKGGAVEGVFYNEKADIQKSNCQVCCEGKQTRLPFPSANHRSKKLLEVVHSDLCGPMETKSIGQAKYFLLFVDDASRMSFVYFLKEKNQALQRFKEFRGMVENQTESKIKTLRTDNGGEFCSQQMESYLKAAGITHQKTNPYTPEQNGLCERFNRTIVERAKCLLFEAELDKSFWAEAVNTAVYLKNRSPASGLGQMTPFER